MTHQAHSDSEEIRDQIPDAQDETAIPILALPRAWQRFDRMLVAITKVMLALTGLAFTGMVLTEVGSRFVFGTSVAQANSVSRFLLVWFFMVGAGLALRKGAHVGLEIFVQQLPPRGGNAVAILVGLLLVGFFLLMTGSGWAAFQSSLAQRDAALQVSMGWVMAAFPIGFALLVYHQLALLADRVSGPRGARSQ